MRCNDDDPTVERRSHERIIIIIIKNVDIIVSHCVFYIWRPLFDDPITSLTVLVMAIMQINLQQKFVQQRKGRDSDEHQDKIFKSVPRVTFLTKQM